MTKSTVARRRVLQFLAASRELRTIMGSQTRAAEVRVILTSPYVRASSRASFVEADGLRGAGGLDAATGCEFVDDRIRLFE